MEQERKKRQKELAKVFYEMGMDVDLLSKISGLSLEEVSEVVDKPKNNQYNGQVKDKNNSY